MTAPTSSCLLSSGQQCSTMAMWVVSVTFSLMVEVKTSVRLLKHKMALESSLLATSNLANNVKVTRARTEVSAKKAGIDSYATVRALATGHVPAREVKVYIWLCPFFVVLHENLISKTEEVVSETAHTIRTEKQ